MGFRWEHPPYGVIACQLDEHGGEQEQQDAELYGRLAAEIHKALAEIVAKPEYDRIISWHDFHPD